MVTSVTVKDAAGTNRSIATIDALMALVGEVSATPTSNTVLDRLKTLAGLLDGTNHIGKVGQTVARVSANFTRPANTTAYASGYLVANSTTAGSVTPLSWSTAARVAGGSFAVHRVKLKKSSTGVSNTDFRLHLYAASPTPANGDGAAWSTTESTYLGSVDVTIDKAHTDGATGFTSLSVPIRHKLASGTTLYGLLEARAAYAPASGETITCELELVQD